MDRIRVAGELMAAVRMLLGQQGKLPPGEVNIAKKMMEKGYTYVIQIDTSDGAFGVPLYFKNFNDVGPFLRSFPKYQKARIKWLVNLEDVDLD